MTYYAHSGRRSDRADWQALLDHLHEVARIAWGMGSEMGVAHAAALAGRLHDLGKYDPAFDARLRGENVQVDHSTAGAAILRARAVTQGDRSVADVLSYAILGHHAGLPDRRGPGQATVDATLDGFDPARLDPAWEDEVTFSFDGVIEEFLARIEGAALRHRAFDLSVAVRMIFSCLVDADRRDAATFDARITGRADNRGWSSLQDIRAALVGKFDAHIPSGALARALQPYIVQVLPRDRERLLAAGRAVFEAPDLRGDQFAVLIKSELYDSELGLIWEDAETFSTDELMV